MKKENAIQISKILGIDSPEDVAGGTLTKKWILSAVRQVPGCEEIDSKLTKSKGFTPVRCGVTYIKAFFRK